MTAGSTPAAIGPARQVLVSSGSPYAGGVPGPVLVLGFGTGLDFATLTPAAVSGVG